MHNDSAMTSYADGAAKPKPRDERADELRLKNNRLGMSIFQISWIMAFFAIAIVNWQLRSSYSQWPPAGVAPFDPFLPSIATLALLLSAHLVRQGLRQLGAGSVAGYLARWRLALVAGLLFMGIIAYEFLTVSDAAMATQYGLTMRLMTGFHLAHALAILAVMLRVIRMAGAGALAGDGWAAESAAKLWYFVAVAWLLFYLVLYWLR